MKCRSITQDFCGMFHTFFIPKWPLSWRVCRNRQLEGISVVAQQFHETLEPLNEWLTTIEKRLANCEPIGTQASKLEEQIAQHKVRYKSQSGRLSFLFMLWFWHTNLSSVLLLCYTYLETKFISNVIFFSSVYVFIFLFSILFVFLVSVFQLHLGFGRWYHQSQ